jgi:mRNA-degrading endonuclease RelE of RelBE toxin-antitoxin system
MDKSKPYYDHPDYGRATDWEAHFPNLPEQIHRGLNVRLEGSDARAVTSGQGAAADHAQILHDALKGGGPLGMHWSTNEDISRRFAHRNVRDPRKDVPVIVHADRPQAKDIETRPSVLKDKGVWSHDYEHGDAEVPVRKGRKVNLTGISWKPDAPHPEADASGWVHHTFGEGTQHTAEAQHVTASAEDDDYRMQHQAPDAESGVPLHDLTHDSNAVYPDDIYTHPHYYDPTGGDASDHTYQDAYAVAHRVRGNPDAKVQIYRSLPAEHAHKGFNPGDWVSTSKEYARNHGMQADSKDDWPVIRTTVRAGDLHTNGDDLREYGYNGDKPKAGMVSHKGGYNQEVRQHEDGVIRPVKRRTPKTAAEGDYRMQHQAPGPEGAAQAAPAPEERLSAHAVLLEAFSGNYGNTLEEELGWEGGDDGVRDGGRTAGRGKPRTRPGAGADDAGAGEQPGGTGEVGAPEGSSRAVTFHPAAAKELGKLDKPSQKQIATTIDALASGAPNLQTHDLRHPLKGWYSTKASRGHRIVHRINDDGSLHIGAVSLHDYGTAERRLGAAEPPKTYLRFGDWPADERSTNNVTGAKEEGVSVYDLDHHGDPEDPDPDMSRGHEHDEYCEPDCDMHLGNDDFGNDTHEEMHGRVQRAERGRYNGTDRPQDVGHLVTGEHVGFGHDNEPLLNNVKRVGDWIDHKHMFFPGAKPHRLARDPEDEDYEPPKGLRRRAAAEGPKTYTWKGQAYGPDGGYVDKDYEVQGPLYHGGGKRLKPGDTIRPGRKSNYPNWGDEPGKSTHVYFTPRKDTAASYAQQTGGHVYEVEPTGDFRMDHNVDDYKTKHPLTVVRRLEPSEWRTPHEGAQQDGSYEDMADEAPEEEIVSQGAFSPYDLISTAGADPEFRFHITAAWADVRAKAKRIRSEGKVRITLASDGVVFGEVQGDHHVYETGVQRFPGSKHSVATYTCGCKWGAYHWGADDDFSRFAGRMCSHALALQFEAQSRGMFGRDVTEDSAKPEWVPKKVVLRYDIDSGDNKLVRSSALEVTPLVALAQWSRAQGDDPEEFAFLLGLHGLTAAINSPWGEPVPEAPHYTPGPTKPRNPSENPGSTGWATQSDPDNWNSINPNDLGDRVASIPQEIAQSDDPLGSMPGTEDTPLENGVTAYWRHLQDVPMTAEAISMLGEQFGPPRPSGPKGGQGGDMPPGHPGMPQHEELSPGAEATLHMEPEGALPFTDGDGPDLTDDESLTPPHTASQEGVEDIVAAFQATAAHLAPGSSNTPPGAYTGAALGEPGDIAKAAKAALAKFALKDYSPVEQAAIINEGKGVRAANLDRLDISGTHYAHQEDEDDEIWP